VARVAIIVINKNDPGLERTLDVLSALALVTAGDAEIVVVDASEGRFDELRSRLPAVRWQQFTPLPDRSSIPQQRNEGLAQTDAETVVFIDASCVPGPDWLHRLCAPIWSGEETIVAGSQRSSRGDGLRDQATDRQIHLRYLPEAPTINLALKRSVLVELGGFDESFRYGSDVDLTWRAIDAGHRIRYVPDAVVSHDWGSVHEEAWRSFAYGRARAQLYLKHPARWRGALGRDAPVVVYPLLLLATPMLVRRPAALALLAMPLWRNRGRRPVLTVAEHFVYGAGALAAAADRLRQVRAG
jgi:GT2 family glycosyltransferase